MAANLRPTRTGCSCSIAKLPERHHLCRDVACRQCELAGAPGQQGEHQPFRGVGWDDLAPPLGAQTGRLTAVPGHYLGKRRHPPVTERNASRRVYGIHRWAFGPAATWVAKGASNESWATAGPRRVYPGYALPDSNGPPAFGLSVVRARRGRAMMALMP